MLLVLWGGVANEEHVKMLKQGVKASAEGRSRPPLIDQLLAGGRLFYPALVVYMTLAVVGAALSIPKPVLLVSIAVVFLFHLMIAFFLPRLYLAGGRYRRVLDFCSWQLQWKPLNRAMDRELRSQRVRSLLGLGRVEEAVRDLDGLRFADPPTGLDQDICLALAKAFLDAWAADTAASLLGDPPAEGWKWWLRRERLIALAVALGYQGRPAEALDLLSAINPAHLIPSLRASLLNHLTIFQLDTGEQGERALGWARDAVELGRDTGPSATLGAATIVTGGDLEEALALLRAVPTEAIRSPHHRCWALTWKGIACERCGRPEEAAEIYARACAAGVTGPYQKRARDRLAALTAS